MLAECWSASDGENCVQIGIGCEHGCRIGEHQCCDVGLRPRAPQRTDERRAEQNIPEPFSRDDEHALRHRSRGAQVCTSKRSGVFCIKSESRGLSAHGPCRVCGASAVIVCRSRAVECYPIHKFACCGYPVVTACAAAMSNPRSLNHAAALLGGITSRDRSSATTSPTQSCNDRVPVSSANSGASGSS